MAVFLTVPRSAGSYAGTYVEVLAASHNVDGPDLYETAGYELTSTPDEI